MKYAKNFFFGLILGIANVIPGVSGGTMAVILNIYDKILMAFSLKNIKKNVMFLGNLLIGAIAGIILFSRGITYLFDNYYVVTNFCFIGLIIGSIPMIYKKAKFKGVKLKNWIPFFVALFFMIALTIVKLMPGTSEGIFSAEDLSLLPKMGWMFISTTISTIGMILPGISGAFMMLMFGAYTIALEAISNMNLLILLPTGAGVVAGGLAGVTIVKNLIKEHPQALYFGILGLMIGSVLIIFPGFETGIQGAIAAIGFLVCAAASYVLGRLN